MSFGALDRLVTGFEVWWLDRSAECRWFVGCLLAAVALGVAGGVLG